MPRLGFHRDQRGSAVIEMALVLWLLLLLAFNVTDAGWAIAQQNAVRAAAREVARVAATQDLPDVDAVAALVCPGIGHHEPEAVQVSLAEQSTDSAEVTVRALYQPVTNSPFSVLKTVNDLKSTLLFRLDPANDSPDWLPGGSVWCDEV